MACAFDRFVHRIYPRLPRLSAHYKSLLVSLAKSLRSNHVRLLEFVKLDLQS